MGVLIAVPYKVGLHDALAASLADTLDKMECGSGPGYRLYLALSSAEAKREERDITGRSRIADVRNDLVARYLRPDAHAFVFWLDADVISVPDDVVAALHRANPTGVTAPAVVLDGTDTEAHHFEKCGAPVCARMGGATADGRDARPGAVRRKQFYDTAGFFEAGQHAHLPNKKAFGHVQYGAVYVGRRLLRC